MNHAEITIRPMQEQEIDEAAQLVSVAMNQDEGEWAKRTLQFHFGSKRHNLNDGREYFVWKEEDKVQGVIGLHHYIWGPKENIWLSWFAVHPDYQRQGIGRKLLHAMENIATGRGFMKLLVETYRHPDFSKALAFYKANGFKERGGIADYLSDGSEMVVYGKNIR